MEPELGGICGTYRTDEKKTQMFWDEIWKRKIHFVRRMGRVDDNINMDLTEIYGENVV
jgi:hypothetical protein